MKYKIATLVFGLMSFQTGHAQDPFCADEMPCAASSKSIFFGQHQYAFNDLFFERLVTLIPTLSAMDFDSLHIDGKLVDHRRELATLIAERFEQLIASADVNDMYYIIKFINKNLWIHSMIQRDALEERARVLVEEITSLCEVSTLLDSRVIWAFLENKDLHKALWAKAIQLVPNATLSEIFCWSNAMRSL